VSVNVVGGNPNETAYPAWRNCRGRGSSWL